MDVNDTKPFSCAIVIPGVTKNYRPLIVNYSVGLKKPFKS